MSEGYWDGGTWVYQAVITNDAMDAAGHTYTVVPGAGNEMEILYGSIANGDTTARVGALRLLDGAGGDVLGALFEGTITAGKRFAFPSSSAALSGTQTEVPVHAGARLILSGTMALLASVSAIAVSQESIFGIACRLRGSIPTVTEAASAGVPVISINTEQVF